ncbi:GGDEF domain-containing protein [Anaerovorax odorimutans]|nr:GGDEF domain-containing protein [Anaerovorax odorimutans]
MNVTFNFIIVLEIVIVNLAAANICLHKKYGTACVFFSQALYSAVDTAVSLYLIHRLGDFGNGSSLVILLSLLLLSPVVFLYKEDFSVFLTALSASWACTMLIFSLASCIAALTPGRFPIMLFAIQTLLLAGFLYGLARFIKCGFLYFLTNASPKINDWFHWVSIIWLILIVVLNLAFSYRWLLVAVFILLGINLAFSYVFLFRLVKNCMDITYLQNCSYLDEMTGLCNRSRMFLDAAQMIEEKIPFYLFYMDLDDFKSVNDSYGHLAGDKYLCIIADGVKEIIGSQGKLYRMSGDEFIGVYTGEDVMHCLKQLREYPWDQQLGDMEFLGFSLGYAQYPEDSNELDTLIHIADSRMYRQKRQDRKSGP